MTLAVYLDPQPDELLSSWVMRTCHANATSFYSLLWHHNKGSFSQIDIDQCKHKSFFKWLAEKLQHPSGYQGVWNMSLLPLKEIEKGFPHRSWIRGIDRRAFKWRAFRYCSACLKQGQRPYFRKCWRLDWYEVCHLHKIQMYNSCVLCGGPVILHRVKWKEGHLAHCFKCKNDLTRALEVHVEIEQQTLTNIPNLLNVIEQQNMGLYSAVHFLEAFLDEISKAAPAPNLTFPLLIRATNAYALWAGNKKELTAFASQNQRYFNLAVRNFGCPKVIKKFHKPLRVEVQLNKALLAQAVKEVESTGRTATTKRISKHLTCSLSKLESYLEARKL